MPSCRSRHSDTNSPSLTVSARCSVTSLDTLSSKVQYQLRQCQHVDFCMWPCKYTVLTRCIFINKVRFNQITTNKMMHRKTCNVCVLHIQLSKQICLVLYHQSCMRTALTAGLCLFILSVTLC